MSAGSANIDSIDTLMEMRANLIKFADSVNSALVDGEGEVRSTMMWLTQSQPAYWSREEHKRRERLMHAKSALRQKQTMRKSDGSKYDIHEELVEVKKWERRLEEAEEKNRLCKRWARQLEKDIVTFKGMAQRLAAYADVDVPIASSKLERLAASLDKYLQTIAPTVETETTSGGGQSMKRALQEKAEGQSETFDNLIENLKQKTPGTPWEKYPLILVDQLPDHGIRGTSMNEADLDELKKALKARTIQSVPIQQAHEILIEAQAMEAKNFYMERLDEHGTPFWYIGNADTDIPVLENTLARCFPDALIEKRPDMETLLSLSPGHMILIEEGRIRSVLNPDSEHIWPAQHQQTKGEKTS